MNLNDIANLRLFSQQIATTQCKSAEEIVQWMGAMQAQDYPMAKWALGIRLAHSTDKLIEAAIDKGEIIRTHLLRPTWHFVSSDNVYWMLELTAPQIKPSMNSRDKQLGLTETIFAKSNRVIERALQPDRHLTREKLIDELNQAKIATDNNRASHLLARAELDAIICSGSVKNNKQTYALLEKRVPRKKTQSREQSLAKLARIYFSSHCPATLQDFTWWSGLSLTDARNALEMVRSDFVSETVGSKTYWLPNSLSTLETKNHAVYLLPAYDEFIISYADRSASIDTKHQSASVSENGVFRPAIVIDGRVTGLWKRTIEKDTLIVETTSFRAHSKKEKQAIRQAAEQFGRFFGVKTTDCQFK